MSQRAEARPPWKVARQCVPLMPLGRAGAEGAAGRARPAAESALRQSALSVRPNTSLPGAFLGHLAHNRTWPEVKKVFPVG